MRKKGQKASSRLKKGVSAPKKTAKKGPLSTREHVRKISFDYKNRAEKTKEPVHTKVRHPLGIRVLIGYLFVVLVFYFLYLFLGVKSPIAIVFGQVIGGLPALFLVMFLIVLTIFLISGLVKRKKWGFYLALMWFAFGIVNALVSLVLLKPEVVSFTRSFLILSSITVFVINIISILYVVSEKNYFFARHFAEKRARVVDKVFIVVLIIFLIITLSVGAMIGYDFYVSNIEQTDGLVKLLEDKFFDEQLQICNEQPGQKKDLCLLILSIKTGSKDLCNQIQSDFYKFSCLQA